MSLTAGRFGRVRARAIWLEHLRPMVGYHRLACSDRSSMVRQSVAPDPGGAIQLVRVETQEVHVSQQGHRIVGFRPNRRR